MVSNQTTFTVVPNLLNKLQKWQVSSCSSFLTEAVPNDIEEDIPNWKEGSILKLEVE